MVNIKDIARLAGVSTATVSRALAEPDKVAESTREKVMSAVSDSGYVTNTLARNFRRRQTDVVLVLVPDISNPFFSGVIRGIERVAHEHQYRILLGDTQYDHSRERAYSELVSQRQADGIICLGMNIPFAYNKGRKTLDPKWPPFVMACEYDGVIPAPTVCIDNRGAAEEAVQHLLAQGHRQIGFINGPERSPLCRDRLDGFHAAHAAAGMEASPVWVAHGDFSLASGYELALGLLSGDMRPTALFCANDEMAIGAMHAARECGLMIPGELSVVGFDDIDFAAYTAPPLTTVRQPRQELGECSMRLLLEILGETQRHTGRTVVPHRFVLRESTAVPARVSKR